MGGFFFLSSWLALSSAVGLFLIGSANWLVAALSKLADLNDEHDDDSDEDEFSLVLS